MNIREVIQTLSQMQSDAIVGRSAIGRAVGATFYLEPISTLDVAIFEHLKARGGIVEGEYVIIGGWPVQFLPPTGASSQIFPSGRNCASSTR